MTFFAGLIFADDEEIAPAGFCMFANAANDSDSIVFAL
jgi:hypothetical protein